MLPMVRGKMFHIKNFIFLVIGYLVVLFADHYFFDDSGLNERLQQIQQRLKEFDPALKGLVIGGSNSMWGVSARQLSEQTDIKFYNFSLPSNGYNYQNYTNILDATINSEQKRNIQYIIWSTIHPLDEPPYNDFSRTITGKLNSPLQGLNSSLTQIIKKRIFGGKFKYLHDFDYGDFTDEAYYCNISDPRFLNRRMVQSLISESSPRLNLYKEFRVEYEVYSKYLQANFPNAQILFIIPPTYMTLEPDQDSLEALKKLTESNDQSLLISKPLDKLAYICDAGHHPSPEGRRIRTTELAQFLESLNN
jgi:hypothetical protein